TRPDGVDPNPMRRKFNRECFRESIEGSFCGSIVGGMAHPNNSIIRRSDDDGAGSALDHAHEGSLTNVEAAAHVSIDQAPPLIKLHVAHRRARGNAGIAEKVIDFA